jgi:hypothetical protein
MLRKLKAVVCSLEAQWALVLFVAAVVAVALK